MIKSAVLLLMVLLSCKNLDNKQMKEFFNKEEAVNFAVSDLRKMDVSDVYNLYYVIETKDSLLYVINTNKDNRLAFMYFYDTIDCESVEENEYVIYLNRSSVNPQKDNCVGKDFNVILKITEGEALSELKGVVFKLSKENKYSILKKGNILSEVSKDSYLMIEEIIEDVPMDSDKYNLIKEEPEL